MTSPVPIHVDVQGTLIRPDMTDGHLRWVADRGLVTVLSELKAKGHPVYFHSGGNTGAHTHQLRQELAGQPSLLDCLPVRSKHDLGGRTLGIAIDDESKNQLRMGYGVNILALVPANSTREGHTDPDYYRTQLAVAIAVVDASSTRPEADPYASRVPVAAPIPAPAAFNPQATPAPAPVVPAAQPGLWQRIANRLKL